MPAPYIIGWEEWVALPRLGLPAIKAKVDTGARTSALHAHLIEPFGPVDAPLVRFAVNPIAGRTDVEVTCSAPIIDRRDVTSSNGERESRYVIATDVTIGPRTWPIEITLTNREKMAYRMLLGRQAINDDMYVDPTSSFRQPRLSYKAYRHMPRLAPVRRTLRIAVLTDDAHAPASLRLIAAATARGHVVETLALDELAIAFDAILPALALGEAHLGHFDIVIPQFEPANRHYAIQVLRQLELMGSKTFNPSNAYMLLFDPVAVRQVLQASGIATHGLDRIEAANAHETSPPPDPITRLLVIGGNAPAALHIQQGHAASTTPHIDWAMQRTAINAARVLKLRLAAVDIAASPAGPCVVAVDAVPRLDLFADQSQEAMEPAIIAEAEARTRS